MRCVELSAGSGPAVFVFPGAGADARELAPLAEALETRRRIVGVEFFDPDAGAGGVPSIECFARDAVALMREQQPQGPYAVLGYSFGGLVALEAAQSLRSAGETVELAGLVDVLYDSRYWPTVVFLRATARRSAHHVTRLVREPGSDAWAELVNRTRALARRLGARGGRDGDERPAQDDPESVAHAAMARWRPRPIEGPVHLFTSDDSEDFACDLAALWGPWIDELVVHRVAGSHLEIVRDESSLRALARSIDGTLDPARTDTLRVLVATAFAWEPPCRLAIELERVGCVVEAIAPPTSALHGIASVERTYRLDRVRPLRTLRRAILESRASLVIASDDRTRRALHAIYEQADPGTPAGTRLRTLIEGSFGPGETYSWIYSRSAVMSVAEECGVRCPRTAVADSLAGVLEWVEREGGAVLKTDGSWGGRGVAIARDARSAELAWRRLSRPPTWSRVAKRFLLDRDPWPLRARLAGRRPVVSVQTYVDGSAANVAAACLDGEMLGAVQAEVVCSDGRLGPSTVIRLSDDPEMLTAAAEMARRLRLTGLCGFDFVRETGTGHPYLIEVNPRATPTAHLPAPGGIDLLTTLRASLGYPGPPTRTASYPGGLVALFPQEMRRDPASRFLTEAYHDIPVGCAELVAQMSTKRRPRLSSRVPWGASSALAGSAASILAAAFGSSPT